MRDRAIILSRIGLTLGVLAIAGCATTGSVKRAQGSADSAMSAAQKAQSSVDSAESDAQAANGAAANAQGAANAATGAANAAAGTANSTAIEMGKANGRIDVLTRKVNYLMRHRHPGKWHKHHRRHVAKKS